jgi:hypothetical protein
MLADFAKEYKKLDLSPVSKNWERNARGCSTKVL